MTDTVYTVKLAHWMLLVSLLALIHSSRCCLCVIPEIHLYLIMRCFTEIKWVTNKKGNVILTLSHRILQPEVNVQILKGEKQKVKSSLVPPQWGFCWIDVIFSLFFCWIQLENRKLLLKSRYCISLSSSVLLPLCVSLTSAGCKRQNLLDVLSNAR